MVPRRYTLLFAILLAVVSSADAVGAVSPIYTKVGSGGSIVATAPDGSIYIGQDESLKKYNQSGILVWSKGTPGYSNMGIAVAPDGKSFSVTGTCRSSGRGWDLYVRRYSSSGSLRWSKTFSGGSTEDDAGCGVAVAKDGSIYVTGYTMTADESYNLLLRKYSPSGSLLWKRTYDADALDDIGYDVAVAGDGTVYVTGFTSGYMDINDMLLRKYFSSGKLKWSKTYDGGNGLYDIEGKSVEIGKDGGIYALGNSGAQQEYGDGVAILRKYSTAGELLWDYTGDYKDPIEYCDDEGDCDYLYSDDEAAGLAVTPGGNVVVANERYTNYYVTTSNFSLCELSPYGSLLSSRLTDGPEEWSEAFAAAASKDGSIFVTGEICPDDSCSSFLRKYK